MKYQDNHVGVRNLYDVSVFFFLRQQDDSPERVQLSGGRIVPLKPQGRSVVQRNDQRNLESFHMGGRLRNALFYLSPSDSAIETRESERASLSGRQTC